MQPTAALRMRASAARAWGWTLRENRVPHYQRLFQKHDGLRQWQKTPRSKAILTIYYTTFWGTTAGVMWMMGRLVMGHKTWWG